MTTEKETKKTCPVTDILENLRAQLHTEGQLPAKARPAVARVARIVTEVTLGRGNIRNFEELAMAAKELEQIVPSLGAAVLASLKKDREEWAAHVEQNTCEAGICFVPRSAPCQVACPAHIDIPSMMARVGHGDYAQSLSDLAADTHCRIHAASSALPHVKTYACRKPSAVLPFSSAR